MSSLIRTSSNTRAIQLPPSLGRKTIGLGRVKDRDAQAIFAHVQNLESAKWSGQSIPLSTLKWSQTIDRQLYSRLARAGLLPHRDDDQTLDPFIDAYLKRRTDLKPGTLYKLGRVRKALVDFFGPDRPLNSITRAEAKDWQRQLTKAAATITLYVKGARQFLADAVDRKMVEENVFKCLKPGSDANPARMRYISLEDFQRVIDKCPNAEWRLLFALARLAGLRVSSEIDALRWCDVDIVFGRVRVRSPKTAHHRGKESRTIPLYRDLLPYILDQYEVNGDATEHVFPTLRGVNVRTTAAKIIKRAGLELWPRLFQNLRSSCQTDLTTTFPVHVVCAWMGNTRSVAMTHYLQVTPEHYDMATRAAQSTAQPSENTAVDPASSALGANMQPRQGLHSPRNSLGHLKISAKAQQRALQRAHVVLGRWRDRAIENLTIAVRQQGGAR